MAPLGPGLPSLTHTLVRTYFFIFPFSASTQPRTRGSYLDRRRDSAVAVHEYEMGNGQQHQHQQQQQIGGLRDKCSYSAHAAAALLLLFFYSALLLLLPAVKIKRSIFFSTKTAFNLETNTGYDPRRGQRRKRAGRSTWLTLACVVRLCWANM